MIDLSSFPGYAYANSTTMFNIHFIQTKIANYSFIPEIHKEMSLFNKWDSFIKVERNQNQLIILRLYGRHSICTLVHYHKPWIVKPQYHINSLDILVPIIFSQWQFGELCSLCCTNNFISRPSIWSEFEKAINYPCLCTRRLTRMSFTQYWDHRGSHCTVHVNLTKVRPQYLRHGIEDLIISH